MEHLTFDYPAQRAVTTRAHVGVVSFRAIWKSCFRPLKTARP